MGKILRTTVGCALAFASGSALAADASPPIIQPVSQARIGPPPFSWTGVYIGGNVGYGFADATVSASGFGLTVSETERLTGPIAGGQIGFNWQTGALLAGLEADFQWSGQKFTTSFFGVTAVDKIASFGTIRPRVGFVADHWLFYATAGVGYGTWRTDVTAPGFSAWAAQSRVTWAAGAGIEAAISNNVTIRLEYLFLDTGNISQAVSGVATNVTVTDNLARVGINFLIPVGR